MPRKEQEYYEWEGDVIHELEGIMDITTSDAQGVVQAQPFKMHQSWGKGLSAKITAKIIEKESRAK